MSSYFNNYAPWKNIKTETIDGQVMVKIPKFYVKYGTVSGRPTWWVSDVATTGFEVHPAFLRQGKEMDCFYIGAYASTQASPATSVAGNSAVSVTWQDFVNSCAARGADWHCVNIYEHMAIALLMMIEMGGPDMQALLGNGTEVSTGDTSNHDSKSNWRGMYSLWGHNFEAITGLYPSNNTIQVWDKNGYCNKITTSAKFPTSTGWWEGFQTAKGGTSGTNTEYDLNYLFLPSASVGSEATSATGDAAWFSNSANLVCWIGSCSSYGSNCGMFCFALHTGASSSFYDYGVRIARYGSYSS